MVDVNNIDVKVQGNQHHFAVLYCQETIDD